MSFPRLATVTSAAVAGGIAFYLITNSGFAGTVFGAALWSATHAVISHFATNSLERSEVILRRLRRESDALKARREAEDAQPSSPGEVGPGEGGPPATTPATTRAVGWRGGVLRWAPVAFSVVALAASLSLALADEPEERIVVTERVVQPVVEERVIVEERQTTVTVTIPVYRSVVPDDASSSAPSDGGQTTDTTLDTSTSAPSTTSSTVPATTPTTTPTTTAPLATTPPPTEAPAEP